MSERLLKILAVIFVVIIIILLIPSKNEEKEVEYEVQNILFEQKKITLMSGDDYYLKVIVSPSNATDKRVLFSSSDSSVVSVDEIGNLKANSVGEATIKATSINGKEDECQVTVTEKKIPVTSIIVNPDQVILTVGESTTLKTQITPSDTTEHKLEWKSSNNDIATIDENGTVTAKKAGYVIITVSTESNRAAISSIRINEKEKEEKKKEEKEKKNEKEVSKITLNVKEKQLTVGDKLNLEATFEPKGATSKITWKSSNKKIATVSSKGVVKAIGAGEVTITATTENKITAKVKITVRVVSTSDIYKFTYDENFSKPLMNCKSYTAQDKKTLEAKLAKAIERVGYGTRAGVVEAARFLTGGLEYRVPYLGPKDEQTDPNHILGRYHKVGLNIGHSKAWGCMVNGWRQGMDCNNFVEWAFINGGVEPGNVFSSKNTYPSTQVVNKIKPGDLMLSKCSVCTGGGLYSHVGIVVGVDDNKIYVAEATTGSIDSIVISALDKKNMPTGYRFSVARLFDYPSEGKLTNMWE